jgi:mRNA-degrading endonuclease RelE of RelBE toxin-antitoxin system
VRFGAGAKGKSGGVRVIYYHHGGRELILLLVVYAKGRQDGLTDEQTVRLRALVRKELK